MPFDDDVQTVFDRNTSMTNHMANLEKSDSMGDRSTQQKKKPNPAIQRPVGGNKEGIIDPNKPYDFPGGFW